MAIGYKQQIASCAMPFVADSFFFIIREFLKNGVFKVETDRATYPFKNGKCLAWDYTCPDSLGPTHIKVSTSKEAGKAASLAEVGKLKK